MAQLLHYMELNRMVYGSGQPLVTGTMLKNLDVPALTRDEQERVAGAFDDTNALIKNLELMIAKKRAIKQGMMQQLLTGKIRLPGFSDPWREQAFSEVSTMKGRIGWQGLTQDEFTNNAHEPFLITGMNFRDGAIDWASVYHVPEDRYELAPEIQLKTGDVLMTKDGTIGKLLFVDTIPAPGRATLNSHLLVFRPISNSYDPRFLYYQLASPRFAQHIELHKSGSTFFGISQESVGKYQVLLPPLPEQEAISEVLRDADIELELLGQRLRKAQLLKQGMMQQLLTGRTRLAIPEATV
ncbi:Type I restriction-modification system, specificity subunit S [Leucobacter sp. 7(1)]|uniref:restriction endonuclease subunit S n=1 Tax=Leucobacter sp. 7(1) TaxID=1255613 RepID=UPI00097F18BD|nr:restriction endonuclease subunit S [Leucobacter sp. 7(1)]SJN10588.1 Type I restriction-modification system, specificity subunit S [Leucobacter sp. 7(1)]